MADSRVRYFESQIAPAWAWWVLLGSGLFVIGSVLGANAATNQQMVWGMLGTAAATALGFGCLILFLFRMSTKVDSEFVTVTFGWIPCYTKRILIADIATAEAKQYNPIMEYGGWGIRGFGRKRALNMRGNLGVLLTLRDGATILVGSARPDLLAQAIGG